MTQNQERRGFRFACALRQSVLGLVALFVCGTLRNVSESGVRDGSVWFFGRKTVAVSSAGGRLSAAPKHSLACCGNTEKTQSNKRK